MNSNKLELIVNEKVLELWKEESPIYMFASHVDNLKKLTAIKFDWGRKEETLSELSKALSRELEKKWDQTFCRGIYW